MNLSRSPYSSIASNVIVSCPSFEKIGGMYFMSIDLKPIKIVIVYENINAINGDGRWGWSYLMLWWSNFAYIRLEQAWGDTISMHGMKYMNVLTQTLRDKSSTSLYLAMHLSTEVLAYKQKYTSISQKWRIRMITNCRKGLGTYDAKFSHLVMKWFKLWGVKEVL